MAAIPPNVKPHNYWPGRIALGGLLVLGYIFYRYATPVGSSAFSPTSAPAATAVTFLQSNYTAIDVRELEKAPDKYKGQRFALSGKVFNIRETDGQTFLQMEVTFPGAKFLEDVAVVVLYKQALPGVYKDSVIDVYGTANGLYGGTNALNASLAQPEIDADRIVAK